MGFWQNLGVLSPVYMSIHNILSPRKKKVGMDQCGNVYYEAPPRKGYKLARRWVMYKGAPEASSVPAEWHGWLHHQTDAVPSSDTPSYRRSWQKPHQENLTGTTAAYRPAGHVLQGGRREKATGDYQPWTPPS